MTPEGYVKQGTVVIPAGQSVSREVYLNGGRLLMIMLPSGMDGDNMIIEGTVDGQTFYRIPRFFYGVADNDGKIAVAFSQQWYPLESVRYFRSVRFYTRQAGGAAQVQSADRTISVIYSEVSEA